MGYIIALVLIVLVVPALFVLLKSRSSRPSSSGSAEGDSLAERGVTVQEPSSDEPTPGADNTNQASPEAERRLPPA